MSEGMFLQGITKDELITGVAQEVIRLTATTEPQEEPKQEFWTITQVAEFLQVSKVTLWQWNKNGILKHHRIGKKIRYSKKDVLEALKK